MTLSYRLHTISDTTRKITLARETVGWVVKMENGDWRATITRPGIGKVEKVSMSAELGFKMAVRSMNRVSLCGEDDADKANAVVEEHNKKVVLSVERKNNEAGRVVARIRGRRVNI